MHNDLVPNHFKILPILSSQRMHFPNGSMFSAEKSAQVYTLMQIPACRERVPMNGVAPRSLSFIDQSGNGFSIKSEDP
jgi:hypothetical protein